MITIVPYYFYHECDKCGHIGESNIVKSGPHNKLCCAKCNQYIKFVNSKQLPTIKDLKDKIFDMVFQNAIVIAAAQTEINFVEHTPNSFDQFLQYWKLYLHLRSTFSLI